ncbi:T9SS type A sorting domain-containing protein [Hymenobacter canadensis]|uniref:T9SS type A sorting domain-containing protein n=1 Tax=Hymenobacter canadensis TaxID=2999067 RepID=A0ABY7LUP5_9BACT|nr:T9SS type A sorting domain-containing protein [Hymenobacter canadensis]WBA44119.1 T9SS type A sorting domain-containing protein [Hymenobacter canadensis]
MKKTLLLLFALLASVAGRAQTVSYNGPESLLPNAEGQYSSVALPPGATVSWSISANGQLLGPTTNSIVRYDVGTTPVTLTAALSNGTSVVRTIPITPQGPTLSTGTFSMAPGTRQHLINQVLRGERIKIKPINYSGAAPVLKLLDFQGRFLAQGDSIDLNTPIRGSYYVVVNSASSGQLKVEGIMPFVPDFTPQSASTLTQPACTVGSISATLDLSLNHTGGEAMTTLGNKIVVAFYDFTLRKTVVKAYQNGVLAWTWLSNPNEYIRTLTAHPLYGIAGIGSSGGALASQDEVFVVKLNSNGVWQQTTTFGTADGKDFGYGISFLNDGSVMATGFSSGTFTQANAGGVDAIAAHISTAGVVLEKLQFGTPENDRVFGSQTLNNGNVILFGDTRGQVGDTGTPRGAYDLFITEISPAGVKIKSTQYGSPENDLAYALVVDPGSGDIFLNGLTSGAIVPGFGNPQLQQVYTARIDHTTHGVVWLKQLGPTEGQGADGIALSGTGVGVIFYTNGSFSGATNNSLGFITSEDMALALYDFNGNLLRLNQFDQTAERIWARALAFDGPDIYVLRDHAYEPGKPFVTTSVDKLSSSQPLSATTATSRPGTLQIYPNPARAALTVLDAKAGAPVTICDALGRAVATAPADATGTTRLALPTGLPAGVYLVRSGSATQRLAVE